MYTKEVKNPNGTDSEHLSPEHVQSEFTVPRYLIKQSTTPPPRALLVHRRGHSHCSASRLFFPHSNTPLPHLQAIARLQGEPQESYETGSCTSYPPQGTVFVRPRHRSSYTHPFLQLTSFRTSLHYLPSVCSQQTSSASASAPTPTNLESPTPPLEHAALSELGRVARDSRQPASHVDEAHVIEEVINSRVTTLRNLIHGSSSHLQRNSMHIDMQTSSP